MKYSRIYGLIAPEFGWVPAPSYILRRAAILELMQNFPPGKLLEIGFGSGALLYDLALLGFYGIGIDFSENARNLASKLLADISCFKIKSSLQDLFEKDFDYVMAFEVLEHIENDQETLIEWNHYLKKGGKILISVPAHMKMWTKADEWAGHYRRYERDEIVSKIKLAGFEVKIIWSLGYPLSNIIMPIRSYIHGKALKKRKNLSKIERSHGSGIDRRWEVKFYKLYINFIGNFFFKLFIKLQSLFYNSEKGVGYLILAEKINNIIV